MWARLLLCFLVGFTSAEYAWKPGTQYTYQIQGRTLAGLHQVSNQFSGVFIKARLTVQADTDNQLTLQVNDAKYTDVHTHLSGGWDTEFPDDQLHYTTFPVQNKPFQLHLKNGIVEKMVVDKDLDSWELNFLKGVVSQLQIDTNGENVKKSKINLMPKKNQEFGVYKTMEDSVNGVYETVYDMSPLPEYIIQSRPELVPLPHLRGEGQFIEIQKTRNFSSAEHHVVYRYGASGHESIRSGSNQMGNSVSRSSVSRIILSGNLNQYTIQSSVTTEKVLVAPHLYNTQKGIVVSHMNLTLQAVTSAKGSSNTINNPRTVESLVYEPKKGQNPWRRGSSEEADSSSSSSSSSESSSSSSENSSSSSSSEESMTQNTKREKRSMDHEHSQMKIKKMFPEQFDKYREDSSKSASSKSSDSYSSESSSEEYFPGSPELNQAPDIEFLPEYMGGWGTQKINLVEQIKKLAQEVGQWVQSAGKIQEQHILEKFSYLTSLVASVTSEQLHQASQSLYYHGDHAPQYDNQQESQKYQSWVAFRDAVAQAGTGPALVTIREWINSKQVQGEEAAQIVSVLANSARYPTTEYMNYFFELVKSDTVQNQRYLNTSSIMTFTELVRKSQVDKVASRNRYPIHLFSKESKEHGKVVAEKYIPWLQRQLQNAVSQGDSVKIQVYIRALGNTAHPMIINVFEPYLEGKQMLSNFQRLTIIASLDKIAWAHPNEARTLVFRIYQNPAETHEIRVAAVMQFMKTNPSAVLLQRMAEFTNYDHSEQVNAAVKSAIESAASISDPQIEGISELYQNAKAAVNLLTPKNYGAQSSRHFIYSYLVKGLNAEYKQDTTYIRRESSIYPDSFIYNLYKRIGGFHLHPDHFSYMTSSAEDLLRLLFNQYRNSHGQYEDSKQSRSEDNSEYSYESISKSIKLETDEQTQVEGNVMMTLFGGKRFFSFDNHTIEQIPRYFDELNKEFKNGVNAQYTKFYNNYVGEIGFPVVMGVPFFYALQEPTLVSFRGQWKGYSEQENTQQAYSLPTKAGMDGKIELAYASQLRGKMGFVYPFNNQKYVAGVDKNHQLYLPLKGKLEFNPSKKGIQTYIQPYAQNGQKQELFQRSTSAYTTYQDTNDNKPYFEGENIKTVHARPAYQYQNTIGREETGYAFDVKVNTEDKFFDFATRYFKQQNKQDIFSFFTKYFSKADKHDFFSFFSYNNIEKEIANDYISVTYNPQESTQQPAKITFNYVSDEEGSHNPSQMALKWRSSERYSANGPSDNLAQPSSYQHRQEELYRNVKNQIQDAKVQLFDASIIFGEESSESGYSLTFAHANSPVSEKSRVLFYYHAKPLRTSQYAKPFEGAMQLDFSEPQLAVFNYKDAMHAEPSANVDGKINFGYDSSRSQISFKGEMKRTQGRKYYIEQNPTSIECEKQMQERNYIQSACRNATVNANYLDKYQFTFSYENVPSHVKEAIYDLYNVARYAGFKHFNERAVDVHNQDGQLSVGVQFGYDLQSVNVSIQGPTFSSYFENVTVPHYAVPFVVYNPTYNQLKLHSQHMFYAQPLLSAVLDGNYATTFDNKSYPIDLGNCYHVFAMYAPKEYKHHDGKDYVNQFEEQYFAVLVKESDSHNKDIKVVLGNDKIDIRRAGSSSYSVQANGQEVQLSENKVTWFRSNRNSLQAYVLPQSVAVFYFPKNGLQLIYDGSRLQLTVSSAYWNRIRGLAGTFDGEKTEDFTLPNNRVLKNPLEFAASYALTEGSTCQGPAKQRQQQAQRSPSYEKVISFHNIISEYNSQQKINRDSGSKKGMRNQGSSSNYKIIVLEKNGKTCFSLRPHMSCNDQFKPSNTIEKTIDFHCIESSSATKHWANMIRKGAQPNFGEKISNHRQVVTLPETCVPKY